MAKSNVIEPMSAKPSTALDAEAIARCVKRMAHEIVERNGGTENLALIGILRRGANLAERLALALDDGKPMIPVGTLDISSYRDDGKGEPGDPRLLGRNIPFALDSRRVVLVDDVLYTGRTVRAALTALSELGRPEAIQLAVLIDRGQRELPIRADYVGKNVEALEPMLTSPRSLASGFTSMVALTTEARAAASEASAISVRFCPWTAAAA